MNQGALPGKTGLKGNPVLDTRPTLSNVGIDKNLANRARKLASVPEDEFEGMIGEWRRSDLIPERNEFSRPTLAEAGIKYSKGT